MNRELTIRNLTTDRDSMDVDPIEVAHLGGGYVYTDDAAVIGLIETLNALDDDSFSIVWADNGAEPMFRCPGCDEGHGIDAAAPTVSPDGHRYLECVTCYAMPDFD